MTLTRKIGVMAVIAAMYLLVGYIEGKAACNPYTYEQCSTGQLRAIQHVQYQERNGIKQYISDGEKLDRVVTGKPTERWYKRFDNVYRIAMINGVWVQVIKHEKNNR